MNQTRTRITVRAIGLFFLVTIGITSASAGESRLSELLATNAVFARTFQNFVVNGVHRGTNAFADATVTRGGSSGERLMINIISRDFLLSLSADGESVISFLDRHFINRSPQGANPRAKMEPNAAVLSAAVGRVLATANTPDVKDFEKQLASGVKFAFNRAAVCWIANLIRDWNGFRVASDRVAIVVDDSTGLVVSFRDYRNSERSGPLNEPRIADKKAEATAMAEVLRRVRSSQPQLIEPSVTLEGSIALQVEYFLASALEKTASETIKREMKRELKNRLVHWYPRLAFKHLYIVKGRSAEPNGAPSFDSTVIYVDATTGELLPDDVRK